MKKSINSYIGGTVIIVLAAFITCAGGGARGGGGGSFEIGKPYLAGSNVGAQLTERSLATLKTKYYPDCNALKVNKVITLNPSHMRGRTRFKPYEGWTEVWEIDACGEVKQHAIDFTTIESGGRYGVVLQVFPDSKGSN